MEKRIGSALILVRDKNVTPRLNEIIGKHSHIILGRQGLPARSTDFSLISLVLEGTTDEIGSLTGQLGRLPGIEVKSVVLKRSGDEKECD
jgi:putative iron-only hydrogenase system regulator